MTMSATFYYRRNIDSVPDTIKRVMHKQAMLDAFPHVFSDDELNDIVNKKIQNGEPYEETLLYLRGAVGLGSLHRDDHASQVLPEPRCTV